MKKLITLPAVLIFAAFILDGCAGTPNLVNRTLFNVQTNFTPQVVIHTVTVTNVIDEVHVNVVTQTNSLQQVVLATNVVTFERTNLTTATVTVTNEVPRYTYTDKPGAVLGIQAGGGAIGGLWGVGGLASALLVGAYHVYQRSQNRDVNGALVQGIETAKEVMATTPQGAQLTAAFQAWLVTHQAAAGVIAPISGLVNDLVNTGQAQGDARTISGAASGAVATGKTA